MWSREGRESECLREMEQDAFHIPCHWLPFLLRSDRTGDELPCDDSSMHLWEPWPQAIIGRHLSKSWTPVIKFPYVVLRQLAEEKWRNLWRRLLRYRTEAQDNPSEFFTYVLVAGVVTFSLQDYWCNSSFKMLLPVWAVWYHLTRHFCLGVSLLELHQRKAVLW